jgi:ABC-type sugar transport system ATPase subunit
MEELLALSDRIAVLRKGILVGVRAATQFNEHSLAILMADPAQPECAA